MKKQQKNSVRKKKTILAVSLVGVLAVIGGVIAYNNDSFIFRNLFHLADYGPEEYIETFDSPANWSCKEETPKSVSYRNHTGVTRIVRVKYEEYWKAKNSTSTDHTTELPLEKDGTRLAVINFRNEDDWIRNNDGYYYYKYEVPDGAFTTEFMESVTFNCDFDEAETYTCTDTATGKECSSNDNDYTEAKYHVYITIESEDASLNDWPYDPIAPRQTLYDFIASQSQGVDTDVDFNNYVASDSGDHAGVNTLAAHANDAFPVHYYRGAVNNHLAFAGFCWRIVRTAEKGATKIVFAGPQLGDGTCAEDGTPRNTAANNGEKVAYNLDSLNGNHPGVSIYSHAQFGYMYGKNDYIWYDYFPWSDSLAKEEVKVASDVEYKNGRYYLKNPVTPPATPSYYSNEGIYEILNKYPYFCAGKERLTYYNDPTTTSPYDTARTAISCKDVMYTYSYQASLRLSGGEKIKSVLKKMEEPTNDSYIKQKIDSWYETWILQNGASQNLSDKLEDLSFCNDRSRPYGGFLGDTVNSNVLYGGWVRLSGMTNNGQPQPSVDCPRKTDNFSSNSSIGNGKLKYPIGMLTADEYYLAGIPMNGTRFGIDERDGDEFIARHDYVTNYHADNYTPDNYLWMDGLMFTSTPGVISGGTTYGMYVERYMQNFIDVTYHYGYGGSGVVPITEGGDYFRPVLALKYRTYIKSGEGTKESPYLLEWDD